MLFSLTLFKSHDTCFEMMSFKTTEAPCYTRCWTGDIDIAIHRTSIPDRVSVDSEFARAILESN